MEFLEHSLQKWFSRLVQQWCECLDIPSTKSPNWFVFLKVLTFEPTDGPTSKATYTVDIATQTQTGKKADD